MALVLSTVSSLFALYVAITIWLACANAQLMYKKGAPHLKLDQGFYIGKLRESRGGRSYYEFLGLRYGVVSNAFQPAEPYLGEGGLDSNKSGGQEVQNATQFGNKCPQQFGRSVIGDIDCLFLNVYVPMKEQPKEGFPTMFWIHGGAFTFGSGDNEGPQYFMDEDIILITINYRLGAYGFLSTGDDILPGNLGLKDQVLALKWVQHNVKTFGGEPKKVTIFGCSAGSASVHYLCLSPMGKGLFQAAIAQSGSAHNFWAFHPAAADAANELGKLLKCDNSSSSTLMACLAEKTVQEVISAQAKMKRWYIDPMVPFGPTVEIYKANDGTKFLPDYPKNIIEQREFVKVPLMLGFMEFEGLSMHCVGVLNNEKLTNQLNKDFETIAPITLSYAKWFASSNLSSISKEVRKYYFGKNDIGKATMLNLTNLYSDANFVHGIWKFALEHATENPVYPYVLKFQDESSHSLTYAFTGSDEKHGATHGDDLQYLFKSVLFKKEVAKGSEAEAFSKRLVRLWASFATHRKPTETWGSEKTWPPISKIQLQGEKPFKWYELDRDTRTIENPYLERKQFWDKIFKKYSASEKNRDEL